MLLALESSCDESALALMSDDGNLLGEWLHSQIDRHAEYGGVVPDLAVGEHLNNFLPLLDLASRQFDLPEVVDRIAVTCGPGLVGCLGIGISFAKSLGMIWDVPVVGVNHLHGHVFSAFMSNGNNPCIDSNGLFPHLGLLVSGGNTVLFELDGNLEMKIVAETVDDAAGEALDKGAKLLGIPYPGGAEMEKLAKKGAPDAFEFPRAFPDKKDMKLSFSGLKTSLLYKIKNLSEETLASCKYDLCASYQSAVVDQLVRKTIQTFVSGDFNSLGLSGGVANNELLRKKLAEFCENQRVQFMPAAKQHTGDNAAMIAYAAIANPKGLFSNQNQDLSFCPGLRLDQKNLKD